MQEATTQTAAAPKAAAARLSRAPGRRVVAAIGGVLVIAAIVAAVLFFRQEPYTFNGGFYTPALPAPALDLTDQNGHPFSLAEQRGNVVLVYFGYTACPDYCPMTLSDFQAIKEDLGEDADRARFVMVTIDPERDTEERLKEYMAFFDPDFIGLRGTAEQTAQVERGYGVAAERVDYPGSEASYLMNHSVITYVIDPEGQLRLAYPHGFETELIVEDLQHLLHG
ncbi:MAG: SCO family protein [Thermomicrobiales bacterium]|nr:SCO family protein [Thermomicrobiales bacterium]